MQSYIFFLEYANLLATNDKKYICTCIYVKKVVPLRGECKKVLYCPVDGVCVACNELMQLL